MAEINLKKGFPYKPLGFNAHYYLGLIYEEAKKMDPAITEFKAYQKLTTSKDGKKEAQEHIDKLLALKGGAKEEVATAKDEKPEKSLPLPPKPYVYPIDELLAFMIEDTTVGDGRLMMDAINLFRESKYDEAMKKFKVVSLRNPKGILADDAIYNVGVCYMKLRLYENAENQFTQLSIAYPKSDLMPRADYLIGIAELERDQFPNAEKLFRKWIRTYPQHELLPLAYARLGDALAKQDLMKDGIEAYRAGLPFFKNSKQKLPVLFAIGENYQNIDNPSKAAEYFEEVLKTGGATDQSTYVHDAYLKLGDYYYQQKKYDKAKKYYEVMMGAFPSSADMSWAKFQIGNIYRQYGQLDSAITVYTELVRSNPESYWAKQAKWKLDDTIWQNEYKEVLQ